MQWVQGCVRAHGQGMMHRWEGGAEGEGSKVLVTRESAHAQMGGGGRRWRSGSREVAGQGLSGSWGVM